MNPSEQVKAHIERVDQSLARLRAERSRLLARATLTQRKRDTRQKILIGGAVLLAVLHEGVPALYQPVTGSGSAAAIAGFGPGPESDPLSAPTVTLVAGLWRVLGHDEVRQVFELGFG